MTQRIDDLQIGKVGEHLVCADLIINGHVAFLSEQGLPFDVIAEVKGKLIRIQVKTTRGPRSVPQRTTYTAGYLFHISMRGKRKQQPYTSKDVDLFALVEMKNKTIGYLAAKDVRRSMTFRVPGAEYQKDRVARKTAFVKKEREGGKTLKEIAAKLGTSRGALWRVEKGLCGNSTRGVYLTELTLRRALIRMGS